MRPIMIKGHMRPVNSIRINSDGDLAFTAGKDNLCCAWYMETGAFLGNYVGHEGAVWDLAIYHDTSRIVTAGGDQSVKLWNAQLGKVLLSVEHKAPCRAISLSFGDEMMSVATDDVHGEKPLIHVYALSDFESDIQELIAKGNLGRNNVGVEREASACTISFDVRARVYAQSFGPANREIYSAHGDGFVRVWSVKDGSLVREIKAHAGPVTDLDFSRDRTHFITSSKDKTAKLWDSTTGELLKTYKDAIPINSACISPSMEQIVIGGGQEAREVTTSGSASNESFMPRFFHKVYEHKLGSIKGHFGPIHSIRFSPDGRSMVSGSEDGYARIHHFDADYFDWDPEA